MIEVNKNGVKIDFQGDVPGFTTEVTMFLRAAREVLAEKVGNEIADKLLNQAVRLSRMSVQELEKEVARSKAELFARIFFGGGAQR